MSGLGELLITSCRNTMQVWKGHDSSSANNVHSYRVHGNIETSTLNILGNDYVMIAEQLKPLLHIWPINGTDQVSSPRMVLPEPARAVAISTDNCYLAVGISKKLYIWQVCSGILLFAQEVHLSPITCIKFSSNSDYLIAGATNGSLLIYNFGSLINIQETYMVQKDLGQIKPLHNILDHVSAITQIQIGPFASKSRFATSSSDNTCRIYELLSGQLLLQLIFQEGISTFIADSSFWTLYLGTNSGIIHQFNLTDPPRDTIRHVNDSDNKLFFVGHTQRVTCLTLNLTNEILVTGSEDKFVIVWDVESRQVLNRLEHKSVITNLAVICANLMEEHKPKVILAELHRTIALNNKKFEVSVFQDEDIVFSDDDSDSEDGHLSSTTDFEHKLLTAYSANEDLYNKLMQVLVEQKNVQ